MEKFNDFFQNFERLKQWLMLNLAKEVGIYLLSARDHAAEMYQKKIYHSQMCLYIYKRE